MNEIGAIVLGIIQGLTEFLPVSSSGHLVLLQQLIDVGEDEILFDLVLHLGTLIPVLYFYRADVWSVIRDPFVGEGPWLQRDGVRLAGLVGLASVPTALIGLLLEDYFELLFSTPAALVVTFAITGTLLFSTRNKTSGEIGLSKMTWKQALLLGLAQGFAITPGISRSGTTISVALFLGLERENAARFSFLMSVPAIGGAVLLKAKDVEPGSLPLLGLGLGGLAALVSGYFALVLLVKLVKSGSFSKFAYYCWAMALVAGAMALWAIFGA